MAIDDKNIARQASKPAALRSRISFALVCLFAVSLVSNLLMLTGPLFMMQVYDRVLASRSLPTLVVITILVCAIYAFYAVLETLRSRMGTRFGNLIETELGAKLLAASARLRLLSNAPAADPIRDGDTLRQFVGGGGPMALMDLPWMPVYLAVVFLFHPLLGWLALGGAGMITLLMLINEFLARQPAKASSSTQLQRQRQADDVRSNAETIVAMGMLADIQQRWSELSGRLLDVQAKASDSAAFFTSVIKGLRFLLQSAVLALGAYLVIQGEMTGGLMIAASIVTSRAVAPVEQIVGQWRSFVAARQAYARMRKVLDALPDERRDMRLPLPKAKLSVHQLATAPFGMKTPLFSGGGFELHAGEGLGVLGPSGSGKSSLARALVGAWPSMTGEIRLDGALLGHYDPSQTGSIIGYMPQRVELFQGTIGQNISRFRSDATSEDIIEAARAANVHDLINSLPNGYDTDVGEQGTLLSAGQQQRVGLARALFGSPFLVVLDEPNSNLDAEGDAALSDAVHHMRERGAIVVVIAHRPSAIAAVDKLVFVKDRRQVAFGPKNDVLQQITQPSAGDNVRNIKVPVS